MVTWLQSGSTFAVVYRISSKLDNFSLRYGDLTIFKMATIRHLGFLKFSFFLSRSPYQRAVLLAHTKFRWNRTIGWWAMARKAIFKMAAATILNLKNFNFVTWLSSGSIYAVVHQILSKSNNIFKWDMVI